MKYGIIGCGGIADRSIMRMVSSDIVSAQVLLRVLVV
jgi:hypothetical protein